MSRVSESSSVHAIKYAVGKNKSRIEDLQIKGSNLKRVQKPSDDPVGNIEILSIRSKSIDNDQYKRNASVAKTQLIFTESAIEELTNLMVEAKELAISQSSNLFDPEIRKSVAQEVGQLYKQAVSISNRRLGNKYIFAGHKSLTKPFNEDGKYLGDDNQTKIEVSKDVFVPISFSGRDIFFEKDGTPLQSTAPLKDTPLDEFEKRIKIQKDSPQFQETEPEINRLPANAGMPSQPDGNLKESRRTIFDELGQLKNALLTDSPKLIQELLPRLDESIDRLISVRTRVGSVINSIDISVDGIERDEIISEEYKSKIEDADVAELFTDLTRQQNVLNATYKASAQMMNKNLMDFIG